MASSCHQWGRGHVLPLSQDWWLKEDPKAAAIISASSPTMTLKILADTELIEGTVVTCYQPVTMG